MRAQSRREVRAMENWVKCALFPGQFSDEVGAEGRQVDGTIFSLFAPQGSVDSEGQTLQPGKPVTGWLRVIQFDQKDDCMLVRLPSETLQSGYFVTVKSSDLRFAPTLLETLPTMGT